MNNMRRKEIKEIIKTIEDFKSSKQVDDFKERLDRFLADVESVLEDEEYYMDNMPENLQGGTRYEVSEDACNNLEYAQDKLMEMIDEFDQIIEDVSEVVNYLSDAMV